jgi:hypothetical protein
LDLDGDGIYHFTSITIPANVTVRLLADRCGTLPVHWLATGDVLIAGVLDLSATDSESVLEGSLPLSSIPGPGGFPGGLGQTPSSVAQPGFGPGAGTSTSELGGSHATQGYGFSGIVRTYGNSYLLPLVGGSGGHGGTFYGDGVNSRVQGGAAGGGAILIASETTITVYGSIMARGGNAGFLAVAGGGSGGAIRLIAPVIAGQGVIDADVDRNLQGALGGSGWVRLEARTNLFQGQVLGVARTTSLMDSTPLGLNDPRTRITVLDIAGTSLTGRARGTFAAPDVTVATTSAVIINARVDHPPVEEIVYRLYLYSQNEFLTIVEPVQTSGSNPLNLRFETPIPSGFTHAMIAGSPAESVEP